MTESTSVVTFEKSETNEWYVEVDGEWIGSLSRGYPTRFSCTHGVVRDTLSLRAKADGQFIPSVQLGAVINLRAAKELVSAHLDKTS